VEFAYGPVGLIVCPRLHNL